MATLSVRARYPLGTFLGHRGDGQRADFPDTARLFSALVHAAAKGSTAVESGEGDLEATAGARAALEWLERHPPSAVALPSLLPVATKGARSYRADGVMESATKPQDRKVLKAQSDAVALSGPIGWSWDVEAPDDVVEMLKLLCADVSCLGEGDSPVVLEVEHIAPTHILDPQATAFSGGSGSRIRTPVEGRVTELDSDHALARERPPLSRDKHSWSERPSSRVPSVEHVRDLLYRPLEPERVTAPWTTLVLLPINGSVDFRDRVPWCVAVHRALASRLGDHAPALLTGRYGNNPKPVNRLAIQLLRKGYGELESDCFALLFPAETTSEEMAEVDRALRRLDHVYTRGQKVGVANAFRADRDAESFWGPPSPGHHRLWRPQPALVPEVRRQRGIPWTFNDAACLSVAFVARAQLALPPTPRPRYAPLVEAARARGVAAYDCRLVHDSRTERYAHKMPPGVVVTPLSALVDGGALLPETALWAAGQSRHLGGGLMVPVDIPEGSIDEWGPDK